MSDSRPDRQRLEELREGIMECDRELVEIIRRRVALVHEIGAVKAGLRVPVTDPRREARVVRRAAELAREAGLDEELIRNLIWSIMSAARTEQYTRAEEQGEKPPG